MRRVSATALGAVAEASLRPVLVQLAVQVEPLEDELERRGDTRRSALGAEHLERSAEAAHAGHLAGVLGGGHRLGDLERDTPPEGGQELVEGARLEVAVEDV